MKLLFDTHAFIWWDSDPARLSAQALSHCQNPENVLLLSVASVWEIQIKAQLGKLKLSFPLAEIIASQRQTNLVEILPVTLTHVLALEELPAMHKDPFDRLLIAQGRIEDACLVSHDPNMAQYPVTVVW